MKLDKLVGYLNEYLRVSDYDDSSQNGLHVERTEGATKVAFAVDACQASFEEAVVAGPRLLIVARVLISVRSQLPTVARQEV